MSMEYGIPSSSGQLFSSVSRVLNLYTWESVLKSKQLLYPSLSHVICLKSNEKYQFNSSNALIMALKIGTYCLSAIEALLDIFYSFNLDPLNLRI